MKKITTTGLILVIALIGFYLFIPALREVKNTPSVASTSEIKPVDKKLKIGLLQQLSHPSLDEIHQGVIDQLARRGYVDGENIEIDDQNGNNDQSNLKMISDQFVQDHKDLYAGIATVAAQALKNAVGESKDPVVGIAIGDPVGAGLLKNPDHPEANVTATTDAPPSKKEAELIRKLMPKAKTIGVLYTSSSTNVLLSKNEFEKEAKALGFKTIEATVSETNDLGQVAESLANKVDGIYVPNDNTIASAMNTLIAVTDAKKVPVFSPVEMMVKQGGLAAVGFSQYQLGVNAGNKIADLLDGKKVIDSPVKRVGETITYINKEKAKQLKISLPQAVLKQAKVVNEK